VNNRTGMRFAPWGLLSLIAAVVAVAAFVGAAESPGPPPSESQQVAPGSFQYAADTNDIFGGPYYDSNGVQGTAEVPGGWDCTSSIDDNTYPPSVRPEVPLEATLGSDTAWFTGQATNAPSVDETVITASSLNLSVKGTMVASPLLAEPGIPTSRIPIDGWAGSLCVVAFDKGKSPAAVYFDSDRVYVVTAGAIPGSVVYVNEASWPGLDWQLVMYRSTPYLVDDGGGLTGSQPLQVFTVRGHRLVNILRFDRYLLKADALENWNATDHLRRLGTAQAASDWLADQCMLGRAMTAWQTFEANGHEAYPPIPSASSWKKSKAQVWADLVADGYCPHVASVPSVGINWDEATVPGSVCHSPRPIRLQDGSAEVYSSGFYGIPWEVVFIGPTVNGRLGDADATALSVWCTNGGGTADGQLGNDLVIFDVDHPQHPRVLGILSPTQPMASDVHVPYFDSRPDKVTITKERITVHELWYGMNDSTCCPTGSATTVWTWNGRHFSPSTTITRKPSNRWS
jgi:hypothetical protein